MCGSAEAGPNSSNRIAHPVAGDHHSFLGGAHPAGVLGASQPAFWGLRPQERFGKAVQVLRFAVQQEVQPGVFATAGVNTGNMFPDWRFDASSYITGWGVSLGAASPLGPVDITAHGRSFDSLPRLNLDIGLRF